MRKLLLALILLLPLTASAQQIQYTAPPTSGIAGNRSAPLYYACPPKVLSLTSATVQTIATITTATGSGGSAFVSITVVASNGTLANTEAYGQVIAYQNNAGTVAAGGSAAWGAVSQDGSGTLTASMSLAPSTNTLALRITPTWVTIVPTEVTGHISILFQGNTTDTLVCN